MENPMFKRLVLVGFVVVLALGTSAASVWAAGDDDPDGCPGVYNADEDLWITAYFCDGRLNAYDLTQPGMPSVPYPVVSSLQTLLDFMAKELPEAKNADARRFVDDRFIRELDESGFIASLSNQGR
jgi:hypothetical protein